LETSRKGDEPPNLRELVTQPPQFIGANQLVEVIRLRCSIPTSAGQGLRDEWVCRGRDEVRDTFRSGLEQRREIDGLEFTRTGDRVVMGARGSSGSRKRSRRVSR